MKYLNLGCGSHYSTESEWTNVDFVSTDSGVIGHNLVEGVPFGNDTFDLVYHSHVLEHFSKESGERFLEECMRVLKPGGILRIAIPDMERIAREYLSLLQKGMENPGDKVTRANYDWMLMEMYDQTVRNYSGGRMAEFLSSDIINESFVYSRIGEEGKGIRAKLFKPVKQDVSNPAPGRDYSKVSFSDKVKSKLKTYLFRKWNVDMVANDIGKFRLGGEIHQWMYDRYSLPFLLSSKGINNTKVQDAFSSYLPQWANFNLDGKDKVVRKPDSLFIEGIKQK